MLTHYPGVLTHCKLAMDLSQAALQTTLQSLCNTQTDGTQAGDSAIKYDRIDRVKRLQDERQRKLQALPKLPAVEMAADLAADCQKVEEVIYLAGNRREVGEGPHSSRFFLTY